MRTADTGESKKRTMRKEITDAMNNFSSATAPPKKTTTAADIGTSSR